MRLALALILALPAFGQIKIHYSRQGDEIVKALIGTLPKTVSLYRADVLNTGTTEARMFPSRVGFEAAATAPMQDPEAALFAAQHFKDTRWWVVTLGISKELAKYGGPAALGLLTAGVPVPAIVTGIAGSLSGGSAVIDGYRKDASKLTIPTTFLRDDMKEIILKPGEPVSYLLVLGKNPKDTFDAVIGDAPSVGPPGITGTIFSTEPTPAQHCERVGETGMRCDNVPALWSPISQTHPQIDDIYDAPRIASMVREASARIGAVE